MATEQNPKINRQNLLMAAFELFYRNGFRATGLNEVVAAAGLSKGALYNHFASKAELGYAVVEEILSPIIHAFWIAPYRDARDPIASTQKVVATVTRQLENQKEQLGCPLNNLMQEMSGLDVGFRQRLQAIYDQWQTAIAQSFTNAKNAGLIKSDVDANEIALYMISLFQGAMSVTKNTRSIEPLQIAGKQLLEHLTGLTAGSKTEVIHNN